MAKLSTPQNVSVSGNTLTFDPVTHATGYAIYAGSTELGTYGAVHTYVIDVTPDTSLTVQFNPYVGETKKYDAVSGWTLYDGDVITVTKMGSTRRLWVNGVVYPADNTVNNITVTNENVEIWTEAGSDASGTNTATVVITFKSVPSRMRGGSDTITAAYVGSIKLPQIYNGTEPMLGIIGNDTYYITSETENTNYVEHISGAVVDPPKSILTDGNWISAYLKQSDPTHYGKPKVTIEPEGVVNYMYNSTSSVAILNMRAPRGNFTIKAVSTAIEYTVTANGTNCTITGPSKISYQGTATYTVSLDESIYKLPDTITVTGAVGSWDKANKTITISSPTGPTTGNPTGAVTISVVATNIEYTYTETLTNCSTTDAPRDYCIAGTTFFRSFVVKSSGYAFPTAISVTNATYEWNAGTGELKVSNPTGNVTVTIAAIAKTFNYSFEKTYCTVYDESGTTQVVAGTFTADETRTFTIKPYEHYKMTANSITSVKNAEYEWNASTGKLTIKNPVTDDGTNNVVVTVAAIVSEYAFVVSATDCTADPTSGYVSTGDTTTSVSFIPNDNFLMKETSFTVTNATKTVQIGGTGELAVVRLSNATGTVSLKAKASRIAYPLTLSGVHCTLTADKEYVSIHDETTRIKVVPDTDYKTNGTTGLRLGGVGTYTTETVDGVFYVLLSMATADVTVTYTCVEDNVSIAAGAYGWRGNPLISTYFNSANGSVDIPLNFQSNSLNYNKIRLSYEESKDHHYARLWYDSTIAYRDEWTRRDGWNMHWDNDAWQFFTLSTAQTVTRSFYTWFAANTFTSYNISVTATHCTYTGASTIAINGTAAITFTVDNAYKLTADDIVVKNATKSYDESTKVLTLSNPTGNVTVNATANVIVYTITESLSGVTATGSHPTTVPATSSTLLLTYTAQTGYNLPSSVVVSGAVSTWNKDSGKLTLYNIDGDISITITGERITYAITENLTNVTKVGTHPTFIAYGATIALQYATASGYEFPTSVTITGADSDWKPVSGILTITNPTGPVTITIAGVLSTATVTYNLTHCTAASTNPATVTIGGSADLKFVADTGYELSATPTVTGATLASWDYPVADDKTTMIAGIENVTGNVTITVVGSLPKLDAPTNLSVSDDTLSFDSVENAEQYEVLAGSNSIGTYAPVTSETWVLNETLTIPSGTTDFNNTEFKYGGQLREYPIKSIRLEEFEDGRVTAYKVSGKEVPLYDDIGTSFDLYSTGGGATGWNNYGETNIWTFSIPPTGDLLTWLQANGTKQ